MRARYEKKLENAMGERIAHTQGLRAIPYILLANVLDSDIAALFLSYIVEQHSHPRHLKKYVPMTKLSSDEPGLKDERVSNCLGLIYKPAHNLEEKSAGENVLICAEQERIELIWGENE